MLEDAARGWRSRMLEDGALRGDLPSQSRWQFCTGSPCCLHWWIHWWMRPLLQAGIKCVVLKGSMTMAMRDAMISSFTSDSSVTVFLMSLKAGGAPATAR